MGWKSVTWGLVLGGWLMPMAQAAEMRVTLPAHIQWELVVNEAAGPNYLKEWVPKGQPPETADWIIVEQRARAGLDVSSARFLTVMMRGAYRYCTDSRADGPELRLLGGEPAVWGRTTCARFKQHPHGAYIDQRVLVKDGVVYLVISEIRVPGTDRAGVTPVSSQAEAKALTDRLAASAQVTLTQTRWVP